MYIGVTGHIRITSQTKSLIRDALGLALGEVRRQLDGRPIRGLTCLAEGADQLFAEALLAAGGSFEVILPAPDYRDRAIRPLNRSAFDALLAQADRCSFAGDSSSDRAYSLAGRRVLDRSDLLFAVWDGSNARISGTAEVVAEATSRGIPVTVIWPPGAARLP
ncbi:hypothetical protein ACN27F_28280 [Solwaraspora sp. WMMB335]|uniref:hypothetical protein n=1 Tax=Solwaraspora sp. WMMB335 TaxID=3404118 RepID=UPI003B95E20B